ncbi:MAG: PAS domain S-box protein [Candidatus Hermodarchaeota archaeon]
MTIEKEIKISWDNFETIFRDIPLPMFIWKQIGDNFILVDFNGAAKDLSNFKFKRSTNIEDFKLIPYYLYLLKDLRRCVNERASFCNNIKYRVYSSTLEKIIALIYIYTPPDMAIMCVNNVISQDVFKHKLNKVSKDAMKKRDEELALVKSEKKYRHLFESSPFATWIMDENNRVIESNLATNKFFSHFTRDDIIGKRPVELVRLFNDFKKKLGLSIEFLEEGVLSQMLEYLKKLHSRVTPEPLEFKITRATGKISWVYVDSSIINIEGEKQYQFIIQDITQLKRLDQKLRESEEKYRVISENATDLILIVDKNSIVEYINEQALLKIFGYMRNEILGRSTKEFIHPSNLEGGVFPMEKYLKKRKKNIQIKLRHKEGYYIPVELSVNVFLDKYNEVKQLVIVRDVSERKQFEKKLKKSERRYRKAFNNALFYKDLFVHDMNNILSVILSSAELITLQADTQNMSDKLKIYVDFIKNQVNKGSKLISNVSLLSDLEEQKILMEPVNIRKILENSVKFLKKGYKNRNFDIQIDSPKDTKIFVQGNELLQHVFDNLLINAVLYNEKDIVEIFIKISHDKRDIGYIRLEIMDNGVGIPNERKKLIFKKGYREQKGSKGMGIGLSLVKKIIKKHEGKIWMEDRVKGDYKKGSNFIVILLEAT